MIVGSVNTLFSYCVYAFLLFVGWNYAMASLCALLLGFLFSFRTHAAYVFRQTAARRFPRYATSWFAIYVLNTLIIWLLINAGMNPYAAGAMAVIPIAMLSYLTQRLFVFRPSCGKHHER